MKLLQDHRIPFQSSHLLKLQDQKEPNYYSYLLYPYAVFFRHLQKHEYDFHILQPLIYTTDQAQDGTLAGEHPKTHLCPYIPYASNTSHPVIHLLYQPHNGQNDY